MGLRTEIVTKKAGAIELFTNDDTTFAAIIELTSETGQQVRLPLGEEDLLLLVATATTFYNHHERRTRNRTGIVPL